MNYKEGGVAKGDQPAIAGIGGNGYGYEASEVPELERREFVTKVCVAVSCVVRLSSSPDHASDEHHEKR